MYICNQIPTHHIYIVYTGVAVIPHIFDGQDLVGKTGR